MTVHLSIIPLLILYFIYQVPYIDENPSPLFVSHSYFNTPLKDSPCKYPFKEFLTEFDRDQYTKCVFMTRYLKEEDATNYYKAAKFYSDNYGRIPTYFGEWYAFAKSKKCRINRYDMLYKQLKPFQNNNHKVNFQRELEELITFFNNTQLTRMVSKDGRVTITITNPRAQYYQTIFDKFQEFLPNMKWVVNTHAQPIIVPNENIKYQKSKFHQDPTVKGVGNTLLTLQDELEQTQKIIPLKTILDKSCKPNTYRDSLFQGYGLFISPPREFQTFQSLPILSWGNYPGCTQDILIPSVFHYEFKGLTNVNKPYTEWSNKTNQLVWRGTSSGSPFYENHNFLFLPDHVCMNDCKEGQIKIVSAGDFSKYIWFWSHRQRLVNHANEYPSLFDVQFVDAVEVAEEMKYQIYRFFKMSRKMRFERFFDYKFILDIDGNGYSGRFLKLLHGNSLIFSAHYATDWFSDVVIPFYHFVPVHMGYTDINLNALDADFKEILKQKREGWNRFVHEKKDDFNNPLGFNDIAAKTLWYSQHDAASEQLAMQGQKFAKQYLRDEDMDCYIYRALIEMYEILK